MSIVDEIKAHCATGTLVDVAKEARIAPLREVYATEDIYRILVAPWASDLEEFHAGRLLQDFSWFIRGRLISVVMLSKKKKDAMMKLLDPPPPNVWELRSIDHDLDRDGGGIRIFGHMATKDRFVALWWDKRSRLGLPHSEYWKSGMKKCVENWRIRFPGYEPLATGGSVDDYLSNAYSR